MDVDASYTTIGTPTYNSTVNRWEILDSTAANNTLYVYKAISNCSTSAPFITYTFANLSCPSLTFTSGNTTLGYSFVPVGVEVDKYEVEIWNSIGTTRLSIDTHVPVFSNPVTGTFLYLDSGTSYKVRIKVYIGSFVSVCSFSNGSTNGPTFTEISNTSTGPGGIRTQVAVVGPSVTAGDIFTAETYSHPVSYTAIAGDTPTSVATALKNAINATTEGQWNSASSAPATGTAGFKPTATSSGANLTITLNYVNSFAFYTN